jgi:pyruvate dehydrogenase (quinone)
VDHPDQIAGAWAQALAADRPMLLEFVTDPNVPPLPPHLSLKQMGHYAKALLQGDPEAQQVVMATLREAWDGWAAGESRERRPPSSPKSG